MSRIPAPVRKLASPARKLAGPARRLRRRVIPAPVRRPLSRVTLWRPGLAEVPVDRLMMGGQNGLTGQEQASAAGDLLWGSRPVAQGPHAQLLRLAAGTPDGLTDAAILASAYATMARDCITASGQYFGVVDDEGVVAIARGFLEHAAGIAGTTERTRPHQSPAGDPVLVAPIAHSHLYQVLDGHHRVAVAATSGVATVPVRVRRGSVRTPLQDHLDQMSWIGGKRELYQPVAAPELHPGWTTVRRCTDRLSRMQATCAELGIDPAASTYLDVASCYGWFVDQMGRAGFTASGVERDPLAPTLGEAVYGIDPSRISIGDVVDLLPERRHDVVSCFSLLHHFALGRGRTDAAGLLRLLSDATGRVLFLDTGQAHEAWFSSSLSEWTTDGTRAFLEEHGDFDRIIDLGPDEDAVAPYADNYARHLFACIKDV